MKKNMSSIPQGVTIGVTIGVTKFPILFLIAASLLIASCSSPTPSLNTGGGEKYPTLHTNPQSLENWKDLRFGMFVHWGPVALAGTEIGWSRGREVPFSTYDSLYLQFNPVNFDADEWIAVAQDAGMKYFVITSKHHDGFSIFDSEYSDYDIMHTPIGRDLMKEMQLACEERGMLFGTYYSVLDWYHPDYPIHFYQEQIEKETHDMEAYTRFLKNQVAELVNKYRTNILWFDGEWEEPWTHEAGMDLYKYCRDLDDQLLINNRVDKGRAGMQGMTKGSEFAGDFGTPEQEIGAFNSLPWESCITIGRQWAWKPNDQLKSATECIHTLIKTIGGDGNLLLNVGPMPDGRIEPRQVDILKEIGAWVKTHEEAIYGTRGGPYTPTETIATTHKGKILYVFVMDGAQEIELPALEGVKVRMAEMLGDAVVTPDRDANVTLDRDTGVWRISISEPSPAAQGYVLKIRTNTRLSNVETVKL